MWSGEISKRNPVRPAGKWTQGLTCQTAKSPACHIQFVIARYFYFIFHVLKTNHIFQFQDILTNESNDQHLFLLYI